MSSQFAEAELPPVDDFGTVSALDPGGRDAKPPERRQARYFSDPGVFLAGWTPGQVHELLAWLRYFACLEVVFYKKSGVLQLVGHLPQWEDKRKACAVFCKPLQDIWISALRSDDHKMPRHSVVREKQRINHHQATSVYFTSMSTSSYI